MTLEAALIAITIVWTVGSILFSLVLMNLSDKIADMVDGKDWAKPEEEIEKQCTDGHAYVIFDKE